MKLKKTLPILAILVIAVLGFLYIKPPTSQIGSILSDDKLVELKIPDGALPDGTKSSDISIKKLSSDKDHGAIYDLKPDGLVFNKPVDIQVSIPQDSKTDNAAKVNIPIAYLTSEKDKKITTEAPTDLSFEYDLDKDGKPKGILKGKIKHFSRLTVNNQTFIIYLSNVGNRVVNVPFSSNIVVSQLGDRKREDLDDHPLYDYLLQKFGMWVTSNGTLSASSSLSPSEHTGVPSGAGRPTTDTPRGKAYVASKNFTCTEAGKAVVTYAADIIYFTEYFGVSSSGTETEYQEGNYEELPISITSRGFCITGTEGGGGKKVGREGGGFLRIDPSVVKTGYGDFKVEATLSETRAYVGQSINAVVNVTDVTGNATSQIQFSPPFSASNYQVPWQIAGALNASPPASPSTSGDALVETSAYGATWTKKQDFRCTDTGVTNISFLYALNREAPLSFGPYNSGVPSAVYKQTAIGSVECLATPTEFKSVTPGGITIDESGTTTFDPFK